MWSHRKEARGVSTPTSLLPALISNPLLAKPNQKPEARSPSAHGCSCAGGPAGQGVQWKGMEEHREKQMEKARQVQEVKTWEAVIKVE